MKDIVSFEMVYLNLVGWVFRLHIVVASPKHLVVTGSGIIILEFLYGMDFSLLGFLICASVLGLGIAKVLCPICSR